MFEDFEELPAFFVVVKISIEKELMESFQVIFVSIQTLTFSIKFSRVEESFYRRQSHELNEFFYFIQESSRVCY